MTDTQHDVHDADTADDQEIEAIAARNNVNMEVMLPRSDSTSCWVSIVKSSLFGSVML